MIKKDNRTQVLIPLIAALGMAVSKQQISDELQKHPDYNRMLMFSDVLYNCNVLNAAYRLDFNQLQSVPSSYMVCLNNKSYALATRVNDNEIKLASERWQQNRLQLSNICRPLLN